MNNNQQILGEEPIGKLLIKYSIPAIIGMIVNALYNVVDRIFIGNIPGVGPLAITGVGVTMPITTIVLAFAMLIGIGATTNISIKLGEGKKKEAQSLVGNAITLSVIVGLMITAIGVLFGDSILKSFGASGSSLPYAKAYIDIVLIGTVFNLIAFSLNSTIRGDGNPKLAAAIMVVGCLTNIVLDAVFIFVFNMGIQGAALATIISQFVTAIWALSYYLRGKSNLSFTKSSLKLDKTLVKAIVAIGSAPFAMQIAASLVQVISNKSLKIYGGDLAIGAMATITSISMMLIMPIAGITQGAQPIIGFNYGCKQYDRAKQAYKISVISATVILALGWIGIQLFPEVIVGMFNKDAELVKISVDGIKRYTLVLPIIAISFVGSNYMQSVGQAKVAMLLSLLRQVILLVPMIVLLPKFFGLNGIWFAQPVADTISGVLTFIIIQKEFKSYKQREIDDLEDYEEICV